MRAPRRLLGTGRSRRRDGERGQILVLFTLAVVLLMALAAVVIDVSLLRNDGGKLQNALDAGALAAAHSLPVTSANIASVSNSARDYTRKNYPGMPGSLVTDPTTKYACLIGVDGAGLPRVADMPFVCKVSFGATSSQWRCTTAVCWAPCDPVAIPTDVCNTIILTDNVTRPFTFGRAVGVNSGNSGVITSAACSGLCGNLPAAPVDVVVLLDRTGSMDDSNSVDNLRDGAFSILKAFDPALQRIALGFTGPTSEFRTSGGYYGNRSSSQPINACTPAGAYTRTVKAISIDPGAHETGPVPTFAGVSQGANANGGASSIAINKITPLNIGDFLFAAISVDDGDDVNISTPSGWTLLERTDHDDDLGVATYWKFATASDTTGGQWTWNLSSGTRAAGIVARFGGVDPADPINDADEDTGGPSSGSRIVTAPSIGTDDGNSALLGVFVADTRATTTTANFTMTGSNALTEVGDIANGGSTSGPSIALGRGTQASAGNTGSRTANAANTNTRWASQLVALHAKPGRADVYGTAVPNDMDQWIPIGFTGLDNDTPAVTYHRAYVDGANAPVKSTEIVQAIGCFDVSQVGTNLATPLQMARSYLNTHGRPGVKKGIILETDGTPEHNPGQQDVGDWNNFTCSATTTAANAVKSDGVELFTIGYGVTAADNGGTVPKCPDNAGRSVITQLASMATDSSSTRTTSCDANENTDGDHFFCTPAGGDLAGVLHAAAVQLAGNSRLVQLYPTPIVTGVTSHAHAGDTITVTGKYFTEAYAVTFGGTNALSFTVVSDTTITARVPGGTPGATVDVQVSTPGGSSKITSADQFRYDP